MSTLDIIDRSPLAAARLCAESPASSLHGSAAYASLSPASAAAVDTLLAERATDPDQSCSLLGFVRAISDVPEGQQTMLLEALQREPEANGRLQLLAADPEFRRMMPLDAQRQVIDVVGGSALPGVDAMLRRSGARAHESEGFTVAGGVELGAHAMELVIHVVTDHFPLGGMAPSATVGAVAASAGIGAGLACVVAMGAGLYGLAEAHHRGDEWGQGVARGQGFVAQMGHHLRGDEPVAGHGPRGDGAVAADRFWDDLTPAQRVQMRSMDDVDGALSVLSASVERLTIAGASDGR